MQRKSLMLVHNQRVMRDLDTDVNTSQDFKIEESVRVLWEPFDN